MSTGTITLTHTPSPQITASGIDSIPEGMTLITGVASTHGGNAVGLEHVEQGGLFFKNDEINIQLPDNSSVIENWEGYDYYAFAFRNANHLKVHYSKVETATGTWSSWAFAYIANFFQDKGDDSVQDAVNNGYLVGSNLLLGQTNFTSLTPYYHLQAGSPHQYLPASMTWSSNPDANAGASAPAGDPQDGVHFVLTALNSEMTTSLFSLVAEGAVEDVLDDKYKHNVALSVSAEQWNNVFWLAPQSDTTNSDGLPNATALYDIDIFEEEVIKYHTKKDNVTTDNLNYTATTEAVLEDNTFSGSNTMVTSEACIKAWSKDIFNQENMDDIWANRTKVKGEINEYISGSQKNHLDGNRKNLLEQLKEIVGNANGLTNLDINTSDDDGVPVNTKANLTRQLLLQLHKSVAGKGDEGEARLLNGTGGIFENGVDITVNDVTDKYYAFLFKPNDTLTFGMTIKHPDQYRTGGADGTGMLEDTESNNVGAFDGGKTPGDMDFKITITMTS